METGTGACTVGGALGAQAPKGVGVPARLEGTVAVSAPQTLSKVDKREMEKNIHRWGSRTVCFQQCLGQSSMWSPVGRQPEPPEAEPSSREKMVGSHEVGWSMRAVDIHTRGPGANPVAEPPPLVP